MIVYLIAVAVIIIACVIFNKVSSKLGVPMLLAFMLLGIFFGSDGIVKIPFDNYDIAAKVCSVALIFIMFYGGFGTKWSEAKPVAAKAVLLSSFGTIMTAGLVGLFCYFVLKISLLESFLIGSVISSTDAASVFSILRSKRLNLRNNTASMLEIESGSNDPFSYMLTIIVLSLMNGNVSPGKFVYMIFAQLIYGIVFGVIIAILTLLFFKKFTFPTPGFDAVFMVAVAIIAYAATEFVGGNGYLSTYIAGIIVGNSRIGNKLVLVNFFDGMTGLMQMLLFFLLGLLAFPSQLPGIALTGLCIALFLTFVARPIAVFSILTPFKCSIRQQLLVSWVGMRGAASIVFAIMAVIDPAVTENDIFHIVFFIVLFSILFQGTLIPFVTKKLNMTDDSADVMKTFTDYIEDLPVEFIRFTLPDTHPWAGCMVRDMILPPESILVLLIRGEEKIAPNGQTMLQAGDILILSGKSADKIDGVCLYERLVSADDELTGKRISDISSGKKLIIMIQRDGKIVIPHGDTVLMANDILVINDAVNLP